MYRPFCRLLLLAVVLSLGSAATAKSPSVGRSAAAPVEPTADWELRVARSDDGQRFLETGQVFLSGAVAPDLVRLPDNHLLAIFDYNDPSLKTRHSILAVSRSTDQGRSWSKPRPVRIEGLHPESQIAEHADLLLMPSGLLRVYFTLRETSHRLDQPATAASVVSAVTRDGLAYRLDPVVRLACPHQKDPRPSAAGLRHRVTLLVADASDDAQEVSARPRRAAGQEFFSHDGRRFRPRRESNRPVPPGNIVAIGRDALRLYYSHWGNVCSLISTDGVRWRPDANVCLTSAFDPAVVRLADETFLMLYARLADRSSKKGPPAMLAGSADKGVLTGDNAGTDADSSGSANLAWEPFAEQPLETELGYLGDDAEEGEGDALADLLAPLPDFRYPIDYIKWYQENVLAPESGNAWEAYGPLLAQARQRPDWIGLKQNMLGSNYAGPVGPWSPVDHPDFENAYHLTQGLLQEFSEATMHPGPFSPPASVLFRDENTEATDRQLLISLILPSLADIRSLAKGVISNTWRIDETGRVTPGPMIDGWATVLRNSDHLCQGGTLIERLVGIAEQNLVQEHATLALQEGVFQTPEEMADALRSLQQANSGGHGMSGALLSEHAWVMDIAQYLGEADEPGGEPYVHPDRIARFRDDFSAPLTDPDEAEKKAELWDSITLEDLDEFVDTTDRYYQELTRMWEEGYPAVRESDLDSLARRHVEQSALLGEFVPSLSRAYKLQHRVEASRRATELAYSIHLFKARNRRWPDSLDELPAEQTESVRTDPFTGSDFSYRLTVDGFTLYTPYENGIDDGGLHNPDDGIPVDYESDDFVFWPTP